MCSISYKSQEMLLKWEEGQRRGALWSKFLFSETAYTSLFVGCPSVCVLTSLLGTYSATKKTNPYSLDIIHIYLLNESYFCLTLILHDTHSKTPMKADLSLMEKSLESLNFVPKITQTLSGRFRIPDSQSRLLPGMI